MVVNPKKRRTTRRRNQLDTMPWAESRLATSIGSIIGPVFQLIPSDVTWVFDPPQAYSKLPARSFRLTANAKTTSLRVRLCGSI
jgi:hypothetical protein